MELEIQSTADGSVTLYRPDIDEHYHSVKGAITESQHIFIDCGLLHHKSQAINLLEIGFGTGLNALLTAVSDKKIVHYNTLELYPLPAEIIAATDYSDKIDSPDAQHIYQALHAAEWNEPAKITDRFTIHKIKCDLTDESLMLPNGIDIVYFDAFAPEKQQEMWSLEIFQRIYNAMNPNGILTTYCAKGIIRRRLQEVGFIVERLAGPPGGKREILRATKT